MLLQARGPHVTIAKRTGAHHKDEDVADDEEEIEP